MRILFVVPYAPTPIRVRPYNLLKNLVERGHQVTLATLWSTDTEREQLRALEVRGITILGSPLHRVRSLWNCLTALPTAVPLQAVYCWHPRLVQILDALLNTEPFDVIHVEHLRGVRYGLALRDRGIPIVWDSVDCISHLFGQAVVHCRSLSGKWITTLELGRTRRYEGAVIDKFQAVLVTSAADKQALLRLTCDEYGISRSVSPNIINVLPNGVNRDGFSTTGPKPAAETLVLSGKMSYHANITMALHLVQDIMPHVWAERPNVRLLIVGQNPPTSVQKLGLDSRVTVTGYVADMFRYLQQATIAVVPAVYGAGIQNKVLEAMACAVPVVSTERAIPALNLEPERDILVANEAESFARQVLRLLDDPTLRKTIGLNGNRYVQIYHKWSQMGGKLEQIYQMAITKQA